MDTGTAKSGEKGDCFVADTFGCFKNNGGPLRNTLASTLCVGHANLWHGEVEEMIRLEKSLESNGRPPKVEDGYTGSPFSVVCL